MENIDVVKESELFANISLEDSKAFFGLSTRRTLKSGDRLFSEKDIAKELYVIVSGAIAINKNVAGGRKRNLSTLRSGEVIGELALFDKESRSADAEVLEDCEILVFDNEQVRSFLDVHMMCACQIQKNVITIISRRLRETNNLLSEGVIWGFSMDR
jgi:CRP-like cAMP-binding protein